MQPEKRKNPEFSLTEIFDKFAAKAVADFPPLKDKFVLYSAPTESLHGSPGPEEDAYPWVDALQQRIYESGKSLGTAFSKQADDYYLLAFVYEPTFRTITSSADPYEQEISGVLEHELGHLIAPAASRDKSRHSPNFCECVADTFSFIRQQQEYQSIESPMQARNWNRAYTLATQGVASPFTLPVLTELNNMAQSHDLSQLTPVQSANLAYRLSLQYALPQEQLDRLTEIFSPVKGIRSLDVCLKKCAEIMLEDHGEMSQMVFTIGKTALEPFLERKLEILSIGMPLESAKKLKFEGAAWDDIRAKIKVRETLMKKPGASEADYLQALGHFDRNANEMIDPAQYESKENQDYIQKARAAYMAKPAPKLKPPAP